MIELSAKRGVTTYPMGSGFENFKLVLGGAAGALPLLAELLMLTRTQQR